MRQRTPRSYHRLAGPGTPAPTPCCRCCPRPALPTCVHERLVGHGHDQNVIVHGEGVTVQVWQVLESCLLAQNVDGLVITAVLHAEEEQTAQV